MNKLTYLTLLLFLAAFISPSVYASSPVKPFFTPQQEEFLASNLPVYAYFAELYVDKNTPEQIAKKYDLSDETNQRYLKSLEDIGIIEKRQGNSLPSPVYFLVTGVSSFSANDPLSIKITQHMLKDYNQKIDALVEEKNTEVYLATPGFWLTEKEYAQSKKELKALEDKYVKLSVKNRAEKNKEAFRVSTLISLIPKWDPKVFHNVTND